MASSNGRYKTLLIRFENVTKQFHEGEQDRAVLQGVNAEIARGEFVAIVGRSGSGKSTLLNLLAGLDTPTSGDIYIAFPDVMAGTPNTNIAKLNDHDRTLFRRKHIGFVFQFFNLIPTLTVRENVLMTAELAGWKEGDARAQADRLLNAVGLLDRRNVFPDKLSGGEQQRVAIARALCADAELILADEPTGNLDTDTGAKILELLVTLAREKNKTLVMVTHSGDVAEQADRVLRMEHGKLAAETLNIGMFERSNAN